MTDTPRFNLMLALTLEPDAQSDKVRLMADPLVHGPLRILWRDDYLIVVNKPAGLAVHRGWAPERDVALTRARDAIGARVYPVHRLDRGTSGVLLMALSPESASTLGQAFGEGRVSKTYVALVRGIPSPAQEEILVDHPLPQGEDRSAERVPAQTLIRRCEILGRYCLIQAQPLTGRLHQIRRHCKHISCPIVGDVRYGKGEHNRLFRERFSLHRMFLHAARLCFPHPLDGREVVVTAPLAPELEHTLALLRASLGF